MTRRREGRNLALQRFEVATQWWEALRRLGATVPTEAAGVVWGGNGKLEGEVKTC